MILKMNAKLEAKWHEQVSTPPWGAVQAPEIALGEFDIRQLVGKLPSLKTVNPDRKWEISSAYQKSIRRSKLAPALKCISAMSHIPDGIDYLWRRACTTAAEDIGPANDLLMAHVVHCATVCMKKEVTTAYSVAMLVACTEAMVKSDKSRIYCQLSIIEGVFNNPQEDLFASVVDFDGPALWKPVEDHIVKLLQEPAIAQVATHLPQWVADIYKFYRKNSWRTEHMMKFAAYAFSSLPYEKLGAEPLPLPGADKQKVEADLVGGGVTQCWGLPSFCYDMHTRTGKMAILRFTGVKPIRAFFDELGLKKERQQVLGWAVFFAEGGVLGGDQVPVRVLSHQILSHLEFRAASIKLTGSEAFAKHFPALINLVKEHHLTLNDIRYDVCSKTYGEVPK